MGYKGIRAPLSGGRVAGPPEDIAPGWLNDDGTSWGRPVGLAVSADGALLVSDDEVGMIYRITCAEP